MATGNKDEPIIDGRVIDKGWFLETTEPYERIYSIKDPFEQARELLKMTQLAKDCKVNNFRDIYNKYVKSLANVGSYGYVENATSFTDQPLDLNAGEWQANDFGVAKTTDKGIIIACPHPVMPTERLVNIDTGVEKVRISYRKGGVWRSRICDHSQVASSRSVVGLSDYGVAVTSESAKHLVQYICDVENLNYDVIPEHNSVSRLGWVGQGDFSPYVDNLIFDGDISYKHLYESVQSKGSASEWIEFVKQIRLEGNVPTKVVLAASFASVLVEPCNMNCFFVHLWNGSGNGKTVALMLAASVWANPKVGEYITTFNSTAVGQELMAGFVNSLPLILDELQIQSGERKDFDKMIYKLSEGTGRDRGAKTGGLQKKATWRNCILTSGEAPITSTHSGSGAINRILEINTEGTKFFRNAKKTADFLMNHYGHAGRMFVDELIKDPTLVDLAKETQNGFFERLSGQDITEKQLMAASLILTADSLIDMLIFKDGNGLAIDEVTQFLATHGEVSQDMRAYEWLMDWLAQNRRRFSDGDDAPETWGRIKPNKVLIIRSVFNKACSENGFNASSFLGWMKRNGIIETEGRALTKRLSVGGIRCQCVVLRTDVTLAYGYDGTIPEGFEEVPKMEQTSF